MADVPKPDPEYLRARAREFINDIDSLNSYLLEELLVQMQEIAHIVHHPPDRGGASATVRAAKQFLDIAGQVVEVLKQKGK